MECVNDDYVRGCAMGKIAVVVVHGIGPGTGKARYEFSKSLKKNVKRILADGEDLVWEEANWEELNDNIDVIIGRVLKGLCDRYIDATKKAIVRQEMQETVNRRKAFKCCIIRLAATFCSWLCKLGLKIKLMALESADKYLPGIVDAAIDLPLYMQEPKGDEIRRVVREKIKCVMESADVDKVVVVGHSLGSVIAFDVVVDELAKNGGKRLAALVTMGSPLGWVAEIRRAVSKGQKAMPCLGAFPWVNFWDPADPVPEHKELDDKVFPGVRNVKVESGQDILAHCAYWHSEQIARRISRMLKCDFSLDQEQE